MKCFFCERGLSAGHTLHRINPKGVPGVWACNEHFAQTDAPRNPELQRLVSILEAGRPPSGKRRRGS